MTKCGYCGSSIVIGGVKAGDQRFCNDKCRRGAALLSLTRNIPADVLERRVEEIWRGNCPKCSGLGPVDVHRFYEVWSMLVLTRWSTRSLVSCRSCGSRQQMLSTLFCLVAGWWGFPWGLILTPVQITRNIIGLSAGPDSSRASELLRKLVLVDLGSRMAASKPEAAGPSARGE